MEKCLSIRELPKKDYGLNMIRPVNINDVRLNFKAQTVMELVDLESVANTEPPQSAGHGSVQGGFAESD